MRRWSNQLQGVWGVDQAFLVFNWSFRECSCRLYLTGFYLNRLWEKTTTLNQWWVGTRTSRITSSLIILESGEEPGVPKFSVLSFPVATGFIFSFLMITASCTRRPRPRLFHLRNHRWSHDLMWLFCFSWDDCGLIIFIFPFRKAKRGNVNSWKYNLQHRSFLKNYRGKYSSKLWNMCMNICLQCSFPLILTQRPGFNNKVRIFGPVISEIFQ